MARGISYAFESELANGSYTYAIGLDIEFDNGNQRITNHMKNVGEGGNVYYSLGSLLSVSSLNENTDLGISGLTVTLSGADTAIVSSMQTTEIQGAPVNAKLFILGNQSTILYSHLYFKGVIDNMTYTQNGGSVTISLNCENFLVRFADRVNRRYTNADQKIQYPSDKGLEFVEDISEKVVIWGR